MGTCENVTAFMERQVINGLMLGYCSTASSVGRYRGLAWSGPFLGAVNGRNKLGHGFRVACSGSDIEMVLERCQN